MTPIALLIPLTFEFFGTWFATPGAPVETGDPVSGSFTFERLADDAVEGEMEFSLPGMVFEPWYFVETPDGWGQMAVRSIGPDCQTPLGDVPCLVMLSLRGPRESGGGDGTRGHLLVLFGDGGNWSTGLAFSNNIVIGPYHPFTARELFFVPEPEPIATVVGGLLLLLLLIRRQRRR
jgi:hypothetical protein